MIKSSGLILVHHLPKNPGYNTCYKWLLIKCHKSFTLYHLQGNYISDSMEQQLSTGIHVIKKNCAGITTTAMGDQPHPFSDNGSNQYQYHGSGGNAYYTQPN